MTIEPGQSLTIIVPAVPIAQPRQRHRIMKVKEKAIVVNYTPAKDPVNAFKAACQMAASEVVKSPIEGPLTVHMIFVMPRPQVMIWKTKAMPRAPHTSKPDRDNLIKSTQDALNKLVWIDDAQICAGRTEKWIAAGNEAPHVEIVIEGVAS